MISFEASTAFPKGIVPGVTSGYYARGVPGASTPTRTPEKYSTVGDVTTPNVSYEQGLELLREFIRRGNKYHTLLMQHEDGTFHHSDRTGQPCIGSIRTYGHLSNRPYDYFPTDLRTSNRTFPAGKPYAVGFPTLVKDDVIANEFWFDSEASPWGELFTTRFELVKDGKDNILGIIFLDTNIDPSLMVSFIRNTWGSYKYNVWNYLNSKKDNKDFRKLNPRVQVFLGLVQGELNPQAWEFPCDGKPDVARIIKGKMLPGIREETFYNRGAYNRPIIDHIFGYDHTIIQKMPQFRNIQKAEEYLLTMKIKEY